MARFQTRKGKNRTTFTATVRVKGFTPIARTFDTKGDVNPSLADQKTFRANPAYSVFEKSPVALHL